MIQASLNFILRMYGLFMDLLNFMRGFVNEQRSQRAPSIKLIELPKKSTVASLASFIVLTCSFSLNLDLG